MNEKVIRWDYKDGDFCYKRFYVFDPKEIGLGDHKDILIVDVPEEFKPSKRIRVTQYKVNSFTFEKIKTGKEWHALDGTLLPNGYVGEVDIDPDTLRTLIELHNDIDSISNDYQQKFADFLSVDKE